MLFKTVIRDARKAHIAGKQSRVIQQLLNSGRFVLDENSSRAMAHLAVLKPSKILDAKDYLKLPFESIWIEYFDSARGEVARERGWNNIDTNEAEAEKTGFLIWNDQASSKHIFVWSMFSTSSPELERDWGTIFNWSPLAVRINTSMEHLDHNRVSRHFQNLVNGVDKLKEGDGLYWEVRNAPEELMSAAKITASCDIVTCPLVENIPAVRDTLLNRHEEYNKKLLTQSVASARDHVYSALAAILLLNCKSGFARDEVPPEQSAAAKLKVGNKYKRASNQKYTILRMRVPKGSMGTGDATEKKRAAHWVMGHPKVRKTGVFWWSPHIRGVGVEPESPRTRLVKSP